MVWYSRLLGERSPGQPKAWSKSSTHRFHALDGCSLGDFPQLFFQPPQYALQFRTIRRFFEQARNGNFPYTVSSQLGIELRAPAPFLFRSSHERRPQQHPHARKRQCAPHQFQHEQSAAHYGIFAERWPHRKVERVRPHRSSSLAKDPGHLGALPSKIGRNDNSDLCSGIPSSRRRAHAAALRISCEESEAFFAQTPENARIPARAIPRAHPGTLFAEESFHRSPQCKPLGRGTSPPTIFSRRKSLRRARSSQPFSLHRRRNSRDQLANAAQSSEASKLPPPAADTRTISRQVSISFRAVSGICNNESPAGDWRMICSHNACSCGASSRTGDFHPAQATSHSRPGSIEIGVERQDVRTVPNGASASSIRWSETRAPARAPSAGRR